MRATVSIGVTAFAIGGLLIAACVETPPEEPAESLGGQWAHTGGGVKVCYWGETLTVQGSIASTSIADGAYPGECRIYGDRTSLGDGTAQAKLPAAYAVAGYYATRHCVRYSPIRQEYTASIEDLVYREAS